jgi:HEAT repeat protein
MGFFSKLFGSKDEAGDGAANPPAKPKGPSSTVVRLQKKLTNKYAQTQDRQGALGALADLGTEEAVTALLQRYTFRTEQTIGDEEEKRMVFDELVRLGPKSVQPILRFLETENAPFWPIRALRTIIGDEATVSELLRTIDAMEAIFDRDIQRKVELVSNLREFEDLRVRDRLLELMDDENEELRVHAVEGLASSGTEEMAAVLVERLVSEDETQRVKTAILNLLIERKWKIKHQKDAVRKLIPQTFWIDDVGVIHRR